MALESFPLQSDFVGYDAQDNPIYDRAVDALFYRNFWKNYFTDGIFLSDETADNFAVAAIGGMQVTVKLGECHIRGLTSQPSDEVYQTITLDPSEVALDRIDRIVIRADFENNRIVIVDVIKNWLPTDTLTRNSNIWELAIADILVKKSSTSIQQINITDLRLNTELCGIVTEPIKRTNTQIFFQQLELEMQQIQGEWEAQHEHQANEWQQQTDKQQVDFETQLDEQQADFDDKMTDWNKDAPAHTFTDIIDLPVSDWLGDSAPFTQTVDYPTMQDRYVLEADIYLSEDAATAQKELQNWTIDRIDSENGTVKFTCLTRKPKIDIKSQIKVVF